MIVQNLTPSLFWANEEYVLEDREFTEDRVLQVVEDSKSIDFAPGSASRNANDLYHIPSLPISFTVMPLSVSQLPSTPHAVIDCGELSGLLGEVDAKKTAVCRAAIPSGKKAKWNFVKTLEDILPFAAHHIAHREIIIVAVNGARSLKPSHCSL